MYWSNYHSHCTFCDGRSSMEDFVKFAIPKGVKKYGFSSHAPLPFLTKWTMLEADFEEYLLEYKRLKEKYNDRIELNLGLEVDYIDNCSDIRNEFFRDKTCDYLIGSIHYLDKMPSGDFWTIDGNFTEFEKGLNLLFGGDIRLAIKRFFEVSAIMIEKGGFDIVGHIDKITFNGSKCGGFDITENAYKNTIGEVLQLVKERGMILEINTKSLIERGMTFPHQQFYPMINDMQIPIVVNSDCHYPTNVIDGFAPTFKALKNAGFTAMQQLVNGVWQAVRFDETGLIGF